MKHFTQLLYAGLLLTGTVTAPVAAQTLNTEIVLNSEFASATSLSLQTSNPIDVELNVHNSTPVTTSARSLKTVVDSHELSEVGSKELITPVPLLAPSIPGENLNESVFPEFDSLEQDQDNPMGQLTNVSQLRDVQPSDWAFEALRNLVERYSCVAGYADGTFRGNRMLTRYEFAAGLNACLAQIERLIQANQEISPEDLITLQRLTEEFSTELTTLGTRVDDLERRTTVLEEHQFSTTTKLFGQAIIGIQGRNENQADFFPVDGNKDREDTTNNINAITNVQLNLITQFNPRSLLLIGLQAGDGNTGNPILTNNVRLGYEGDTDGSVEISDLTYRHLIGNQLAVIVGPVGVNAVNVFRGANRVESAGLGPLSRFAQRNPIINIGAGRGGFGFDWQPNPRISLQGVYSASLPDNSDVGSIFGGELGETAFGLQLAVAPIRTIDVAFNYINAYSPFGRLGTGVGDDQLTVNSSLKTDAFGATVSWRVTPRLTLGVWGGYTTSRIPDEPGNVETVNWMAFLNFPDLFGEGNLGGIYVGQPPKIVSSDLPTGRNIPDLLAGGLGREGDQPGTTTHVEAFFRYHLSNNISITPGVIVIFEPTHTPDNDTIVIGALRTTFSF